MCFDPVSATVAATAAEAATATAMAETAAMSAWAAESAVAASSFALPGWAGTAMQAAGFVGQAFTSMQQSQATADAANYQAAVQANNARLAEIQAQDAITRGEKAVEDHSRKVAALKGSQTASMAARGLDLSEGTPLSILTDTDLFGEMDKNTIKANAGREAWGYRAQAANAGANAGLYRMQAENQSPLLTGAGTLLAGAGAVSDKWYRYKTGNAGTYIG
jgi:hypothetical protein